MRFLDELTQQEIAARLGISQAHVSGILSRTARSAVGRRPRSNAGQRCNGPTDQPVRLRGFGQRLPRRPLDANRGTANRWTGAIPRRPLAPQCNASSTATGACQVSSSGWGSSESR
ncbi:sigma factor-like helix-turn-helix DNA-binding protein [Actinocatenispora sera]|uniref:sigma factor-like helix-turn-helix DNA-binding protein n=1 Tax=Actinocatenispora sera TaxID=390989 RepID=UPI003F4D6B54